MQLSVKPYHHARRIANEFAVLGRPDVARDYMLGYPLRNQIEAAAAGLTSRTRGESNARAKMHTEHPTVPNFFYDARTTRDVADSRSLENRRSTRAVVHKELPLAAD